VLKYLVEQGTSEQEVRALIPIYGPLKVEICKKCKNLIAELKELIRIEPSSVNSLVL
jgi:RNase P subunit RPR2